MLSNDQKDETVPRESGAKPTTLDSSSSPTPSQTTSGVTDSLHSWSEQALAKVEEIQAAFRTKTNIRDMIVDNAVDTYLNMNYNAMQKLHHWECASACLLISELAMHVQSQINDMLAKAKWAEERTTKMICGSIQQYGDKFTPYEYRRQIAIKDNEAAISLEQIRVKCQLCVNEMSFMPTNLRNIANAYANLAEAKRYKRETP